MMEKNIESLYLHFPFCRHLCNYCDFFKKVPQNSALELSDFHRYLDSSMIEHQKLMESNGYSWSALKTLYIGGGTPSLWGVEGAHFLKNFLHKNQIELDKNCEFTLEVNPGSWNEEGLNQWRANGANRFSLGVQAMNEQAIKALDRVHNLEDVKETLKYFQKHQLNFSLDFMLGLPFSKDYQRNVLDELNEMLDYRPNHFSIYILTVKNNYTYFDQLPNEEWIEQEFLSVSKLLESRGFKHYEVSNFALPGSESRHNLAYWKSQTVASLGPSATGLLAEDRIRYKWKTKEAQFEREDLSIQEFKLEELYMSLRSTGINLEEKMKIDGRWKELSLKWIQLSLAEMKGQSHLELTSKGYLLLDTLMNDIFVLKLEM